MDILQTIIQEFNLTPSHANNIVSLIDEGNTIPFIARYRKEMTGSCDDQVLRELFDRLTYLRNLEKRKEEVASAIEEQGKLTVTGLLTDDSRTVINVLPLFNMSIPVLRLLKN